MKFYETSNLSSLNKSTYVNLRWIAYIGQLVAIFTVEFFLQYNFNYILCILIIFFSILTNLYLKFQFKENQLNNYQSTYYLAYDILQLGFLLYLTGGITNPFIILIIIPAVFSSQYLNIISSVILVIFTTTTLVLLTFNYYELPGPVNNHFHAPEYYLYSIPLSIFIGLIFLVYFGVKFAIENKKRNEAYEKMQEMMAKENELVSLGGQAAAAAHSLGTPLSTILLIAKELQKEFGLNEKIKNDLDLLVSQSNRCSEILKKLSLNPNIEDKFIDSEVSFENYIEEIVRSYEEISDKKFLINIDNFKNPINFTKSSEIVYGLRNFIGNSNKFTNENIFINLKSDSEITEITIEDDGEGYPKDILSKIGEPYLKTSNPKNKSKIGLGLGLFIGKTLLEKNFASVTCRNSKTRTGAEVIIKWKNKDLFNI